MSYRVIILCLLIVVLIIVIYSVVTSDAYLRMVAEKNEKLSNGTYDRFARTASRTRREMRNPRAEDYWQLARTIRYNLLENNLAHRTTPDEQEAVNEMFELYEAAAARPFQPANAVMFVIDVAGVLPHVAAGVHADGVQAARERMAAADNRAEAAIEYLEAVRAPVEDRQNVHDTTLNSELREALDHVRLVGPVRLPNAATNTEVTSRIIESDMSDERKEHAMETLAVMSKNNKIETFGGYENDILSTIWGRTRVEKAVGDSVVSALADSYENGSVVCINGRCSRVIESLFMVDPDFKQSRAMTAKAYKDKIFTETQEILKSELAAPADPVTAQIIAEYEGGDAPEETPEIAEARERFNKRVADRINSNISTYADKLSAGDLAKVREDALVILA